MTYEEAKDVLKNTYIRFSRCNGKVVFLEASKKALEAIDKQIPQKPEVVGGFTLCPRCFKEKGFSYDYLVGMKQNMSDKVSHCLGCGQAIDWSEAK